MIDKSYVSGEGKWVMADMKLGVIETKFADLIWAKEPLTTAELVRLCQEEFQWKRTTTYTVLKRLGEKGIFQNENGVVSSLVSRQEFYSMQSTRFVDEAFQGSLPAFFAAFTAKKELSAEEIGEIRRMIDTYEEGKA